MTTTSATPPTVLQPLTDRVAVVTGASAGIGEHTARYLAARGAKVALVARRKDKLEAIAADIASAGGTVEVFAADVTDAEALSGVAEQIKAQLGSASIVFANAGIMLPGAIVEHSTDQWKQMIDLNVGAVMNTIGAFVDQLVETAANGPSDLVLTSSVAAQNITPNFAVYSATKAYVTHLATHLRVELGPKDVRVSALEPGIVGTELQSHLTDQGAIDMLENSKQDIAWLTGEDVAEMVSFIVSLPAHVNIQQVMILPTHQPM